MYRLIRSPLFYFQQKFIRMDKNQIKKVKEVNKLLIKKFGIPKRNESLPDPLDMLIATILSQNTNDKNSYQAYKNLKKKFPTWDKAAGAKRETIEKEIKIAGLGFQKSGAIHSFLKDLKKSKTELSLNYLNGMKDETILEELVSFKGIGVKTASCVLLFAMDKNICPVDTHVNRTVNRLGITHQKTPDKTFWELNENFPPKIAHSFHTNLIRLGREICKPKKPNCPVCPLLNICDYPDKTTEIFDESKPNDFMLLDNVF